MGDFDNDGDYDLAIEGLMIRSGDKCRRSTGMTIGRSSFQELGEVQLPGATTTTTVTSIY